MLVDSSTGMAGPMDPGLPAITQTQSREMSTDTGVGTTPTKKRQKRRQKNDNSINDASRSQPSRNQDDIRQTSGNQESRRQPSGNQESRRQPSGNQDARLQRSGNQNARLQRSGNQELRRQQNDYQDGWRQPNDYKETRLPPNDHAAGTIHQASANQDAENRQRNDVTTDGKWRPYWHRGHTTMDEMNEQIRLREKKSVSKHLGGGGGIRKNKLYHSSLDLRGAGKVKKKVKIAKYASTQGLHRMPPIDIPRRGIDPLVALGVHSQRMSHGNSSLNLPLLDPEIEVTGEAGSRDHSATTSAGVSSRHERLSSVHDSDEDAGSDGECDIYMSDDDPEVARKNLDKAGDYIVEHDWILKESLAKEARNVCSMHNKIRITLPDEDPLEQIRSRMDEISLMVKPRAEYGNYIEKLDPEQKQKIVKYKHIHHADIRKKKRKHWTPIDRFQDAVYKVILLYRACKPRRRYLNDDKLDTSPDGVKKIKQSNNIQEKDNLKSSLGFDMRLALVTQDNYRTEDDIKKVTQILRATKAFKHLFPAQLESQLARVVAYERYDGRRILAQQGRDPERFYFILTGKLSRVREYRLLSGIVTREEGFIEKGSTTDPQEMSQNWVREHHLVSKGYVEVLMIHKEDFLDLLHTCKGPPIDFLQGLDLFKEFPCEEFRTNPDAIDFKYYGQENIIVKDSNRTPWLYVVKTGHIKVVRSQAVIDVNNEDKLFSGQAKEDLGCVRPFSHAGAMLGLLSKQRKMKTLVGAISFPEEDEMYELNRVHRSVLVTNNNTSNLSSTTSSVDNSPRPGAAVGTAKPATNGTAEPATESESSKKKSRSNGSQSPNSGGSEAELKFDTNSQSGSSSARLEEIKEDTENNNAKKMKETPVLRITSPRLKPSSSTRKGSNAQSIAPRNSVTLPPIQTQRSEDFQPHGTYLTRERTEVDPVYKKKGKKDMTQRETYLQLDVLKPGDIFGIKGVADMFKALYPFTDRHTGLEHMEPQALASEAPGVTLISDGAEIIKISKRFFLQYAKNNTMLKVETMQREYMSPDEAKTVMYDKETWRQYKSVLLQRTVENLNRNHAEKVP